MLLFWGFLFSFLVCFCFIVAIVHFSLKVLSSGFMCGSPQPGWEIFRLCLFFPEPPAAFSKRKLKFIRDQQGLSQGRCLNQDFLASLDSFLHFSFVYLYSIFLLSWQHSCQKKMLFFFFSNCIQHLLFFSGRIT